MVTGCLVTTNYLPMSSSDGQVFLTDHSPDVLGWSEDIMIVIPTHVKDAKFGKIMHRYLRHTSWLVVQ